MIDKTHPKYKRLLRVSNPVIAQYQAYKYFGRKNGELFISNVHGKKYAIHVNGKTINFGSIDYQDYTKHRNKERRKNYLARSGGIRGSWKTNKYSPNNLSRLILW